MSPRRLCAALRTYVRTYESAPLRVLPRSFLQSRALLRKPGISRDYAITSSSGSPMTPPRSQTTWQRRPVIVATGGNRHGKSSTPWRERRGGTHCVERIRHSRCKACSKGIDTCAGYWCYPTRCPKAHWHFGEGSVNFDQLWRDWQRHVGLIDSKQGFTSSQLKRKYEVPIRVYSQIFQCNTQGEFYSKN